MKFPILLAALASTVSCLKVMAPIYVYPVLWDETTTEFAQWKELNEAVDNHPTVEFQVIINPGNGRDDILNVPNIGPDSNWIKVISDLNKKPNVQTYGYVYTLYGNRSADEVKQNITTYAGYSKYTAANISIHGIFFDEVSADGLPGNTSYYQGLTKAAQDIFGFPVDRILNPGQLPSPNTVLWDSCEFMVAFESCFRNDVGAPSTCSKVSEYRGQSTVDLIKGVVGSTHLPKTAILVHDFGGTDGTIEELNRLTANIKQNSIGSAFISSTKTNWNQTALLPASVGNFAQAVKLAG